MNLKKDLLVSLGVLTLLGAGGAISHSSISNPVHADAFENALKNNPNAAKALINKFNKDGDAQDVKYDEHMYGGAQGDEENAKEMARYNNLNDNNTNSDNAFQSDNSDVQNDNTGEDQANNVNLQKQEKIINSTDNELNRLSRTKHHNHKRSNRTKRARVNYHKSYRKNRKVRVNKSRKHNKRNKINKRSRKLNKRTKRNHKLTYRQRKQLNTDRNLLKKYNHALKRTHRRSTKRYYRKLINKTNQNIKRLNKINK